MSTEVNDGGSAFPVQEALGLHNAETGMSLRDHFAGEALVGLLSNSMGAGEVEPMVSYLTTQGRKAADWLAGMSYMLADAMIDARAAGPEKSNG